MLSIVILNIALNQNFYTMFGLCLYVFYLSSKKGGGSQYYSYILLSIYKSEP